MTSVNRLKHRIRGICQATKLEPHEIVRDILALVNNEDMEKDAETANEIIVVWPDGDKTVRYENTISGRLELIHGASDPVLLPEATDRKMTDSEVMDSVRYISRTNEL